jgi:hypothetical protein
MLVSGCVLLWVDGLLAVLSFCRNKQAALDMGIRTGWGGPTVERDGQLRPRDEKHPAYPFKMLANGQNDVDAY